MQKNRSSIFETSKIEMVYALLLMNDLYILQNGSFHPLLYKDDGGKVSSV